MRRTTTRKSRIGLCSGRAEERRGTVGAAEVYTPPLVAEPPARGIEGATGVTKARMLTGRS